MKKILLLADKYLKFANQLNLFDYVPKPILNKSDRSASTQKKIKPKIKEKLDRANDYIKNIGFAQGNEFILPKDEESINKIESSIYDVVKEISEEMIVDSYYSSPKFKDVRAKIKSMKTGESVELDLPIDKLDIIDRYHSSPTRFALRVKITEKNNGLNATMNCHYNEYLKK
jgi:hypothetical protein